MYHSLVISIILWMLARFYQLNYELTVHMCGENSRWYLFSFLKHFFFGSSSSLEMCNFPSLVFADIYLSQYVLSHQDMR